MNFITAVTGSVFTTLLIFANCLSAASQTDSIYRLAAGTRLTLKMDAGINSKVSGVNDTFTATVATPLVIRETTILPVGVVIEGRVTNVSPASALGNGGTLEVVFESMRFNKEVLRKISGGLVNELQAESVQTAGILSIAGGTVIGAVFGALSGSRSGTLIGAGIGAGAGTGVALLRKGRDVGIQKGEEFEIELEKEVLLPVMDY